MHRVGYRGRAWRGECIAGAILEVLGEVLYRRSTLSSHISGRVCLTIYPLIAHTLYGDGGFGVPCNERPG
jgi:hypothetical protein